MHSATLAPPSAPSLQSVLKPRKLLPVTALLHRTSFPTSIRRAAVPVSKLNISAANGKSVLRIPTVVVQAAATTSAASKDVTTRTVRVHYVRRDKKYAEWGLHVWGDTKSQTDWQRPLSPHGLVADGIYWDVPMKPDSRFLGVLVHVGETKSARAEIQIKDLGDKSEVWLAGDEQKAFTGGRPDLSGLPVGSLNKQAAIWVSKDIIAWRHPLRDTEGARTFTLHAKEGAGMWIDASGVRGAQNSIALEPLSTTLPKDLAAKWPYLAGCAALKVPEGSLSKISSLMKSQLLISCSTGPGSVVDATGVQVQGGLDAHFFYDGPLGNFVNKETGKLMAAVWAPTAQSVTFLHYKEARGGSATEMKMSEGVMGPGVWSVELPDGALWTYYKYRVHVYSAVSVRMEMSESTDPYSRSLAADGERTQIVPEDLRGEPLVPSGWEGHSIPTVPSWTDISLYEMHIRDFSITDPSVPDDIKGSYLAFNPDRMDGKLSNGLKHLATLREAGMNHLHLLPTYDYGSVPERKEDQRTVSASELVTHAADSEAQQAAVLKIADQDGFNWGYDPVHYGVPEGSYATQPDGAPRIKEFREMVLALHRQDWRVVLDVVYNHTFAAGPSSRYSVLDKIVPGYYHRRFEDGEMCHSTCCNNTACEHAMCERLVVDDIIHWAKNYKIDGFRFDIMGHLLVSTLEKMRVGLDALTMEKDGVDGKAVYIYGEAWDFGEVVENQRGINCGQMNLAGTKLGAFNDRLRDGALGGGPFAPHDFQGFATGLALAPSSCTSQGTPDQQLQELLVLSDWIRFSLAGNLRSFPMETYSGENLTGETAKAHGLPLAYGAHPCEHIAFIGCHDNLTMFDIITEKAALTASAEERVRMHMLCLSLITLSQGIPFIHAGDDLLRSKSLDRDSYNSGDWFNAIDWTGETHNLGIGLPVHTKNGGGWHYKRPLLTNPMIKPKPAQLKATAAVARQFLKIRYSSPLFRLPTTEAVLSQLTFTNTGPNQVPGVIVMKLESSPAPPPSSTPPSYPLSNATSVHDPNFSKVVVVFNAAPLEQELAFPPGVEHLELHPLQSASGSPDTRAAASVADDSIKMLRVPARTTAVFVTPR